MYKDIGTALNGAVPNVLNKVLKGRKDLVFSDFFHTFAYAFRKKGLDL